MVNNFGFDTNKKKSTPWGKGGITGGNTPYNQIKPNDKFKIQNESGLNQHKSNITTDKPFDEHIDS
jgi:hypothetical protein